MRRLASLVIFVVALLAPRLAAAAELSHYDLTSLAYEADMIVKARQLREVRPNDSRVLRTMYVTRVYKGDLALGAPFEISYGGYALTPYLESMSTLDPDAAPRHVIGDDLIFFLKPLRSSDDKGYGDFSIVSSGLRITLDGKAQRFVQVNNPGGYYPVPQGRDPFDLSRDPRGGEALDLAGLESEIYRAMSRAEDVKKALGAPDSPAQRRLLVSLVAFAPPAIAFTESYSDIVAAAIIDELAKRSAFRDMLEALARNPNVDLSSLPHRPTLEILFKQAEDATLPAEARVAALSAIRTTSTSLILRMKDAERRTIALLGDPSPEVRIAALIAYPTENPSEALIAAIVGRWKVETNDFVRFKIYQTAGFRHFLVHIHTAIPPAPFPILTAKRARDVVEIQWADNTESAELFPSSATILGRRPGEPDRTFDLVKGATIKSNGSPGYLIASVAFEPPLPPGPVNLELKVTLAGASRTFSLGSMAIEAIPPLVPAPPAPPVPPPPKLPPEPAATPPASAAPIIEAKQEPKRSSCGCEIVPRTSSPAPWLVAAALSVLRRRRMSRASGHGSTSSPRGSGSGRSLSRA